MDFLSFPDEIQFLAFMRVNYLELLLKLLDQSQLNRRALGLRLLVEEPSKHWTVILGATFQTQFLLDTKLVPVAGYQRSKRDSDFAGSVDSGVCPSRNTQGARCLKYFGYKVQPVPNAQSRTQSRRYRPSSLGTGLDAVNWVVKLGRYTHFTGQTGNADHLGWHPGHLRVVPPPTATSAPPQKECWSSLEAMMFWAKGAFGEKNVNIYRMTVKETVSVFSNVRTILFRT